MPRFRRIFEGSKATNRTDSPDHPKEIQRPKEIQHPKEIQRPIDPTL
jgi:hypothetical protein